ncbi:hypothetical protein FS847_22820 [Streptomyces sp. ISID311]|nr:hypothetical protein FS847_22820 [Streptomyces sp. ISID311]
MLRGRNGVPGPGRGAGEVRGEEPGGPGLRCCRAGAGRAGAGPYNGRSAIVDRRSPSWSACCAV